MSTISSISSEYIKQNNFMDELEEFFEDEEVSKVRYKLFVDFDLPDLEYTGKKIIIKGKPKKKKKITVKVSSAKTKSRKKNKKDIF